MRVPSRFATKDSFAPSVATTHSVAPGGGDGSFPTGSGSNPGDSSGSSSGGAVPVVYFTDQSVGSTIWHWSFRTVSPNDDLLGGDVVGGSLVKNPIFTFPSAGTYTVCLKVGAFEVDAPGGDVAAGNIDIHNRPVHLNDDGSYSTVLTITIDDDSGTVVIPTIGPFGVLMTNDEAIAWYQFSGQHLGIFSNSGAAEVYAEALHVQQEQEYVTYMKIHTVVVA